MKGGELLRWLLACTPTGRLWTASVVGIMMLFVLWHVGVLPLLPGTWIAMSVFFTLSAFLITRLLLSERQAHGDIRMGEFFRRRARRLMPALLVTLAAVTIDGLFFAAPENKVSLRGDVLSSLFYVMSWRLVLRDDLYFDDFGLPSITRHLWSLPVEEQFYLLVPTALVGVLAVAHRRLSRSVPFVIVALLSAGWSATINLETRAGQAHAYYGTDVRAQALAVGVALGVWTARRGASGRLLGGREAESADRSSRRATIVGTCPPRVEVADPGGKFRTPAPKAG